VTNLLNTKEKDIVVLVSSDGVTTTLRDTILLEMDANIEQLESTTQKLSLNSDKSAPILEIALDSDISATKLKEDLEKIWKATQKSPEVTLKKTNSVNKMDNFFGTKEVRQILKQGHLCLKELQSKHPFSYSRDFFDLLKKYPLYPMPTIVSKLYLCFALYSPNEKRKFSGRISAFESSFRLLEGYLRILNEIEKLSPLKKSEKRKVLKEKEDVEDQMCLFTGNTLSKLFIIPMDDDIAKVILRENYYNTLNILRVYEFTILDLMGVDKKSQASFVSAIDLNSDTWSLESDDLFMREGLKEVITRIKDDAVVLFTLAPSAQKTTNWEAKIKNAPLNVRNWINNEVITDFFNLSKFVLEQQLFWCGNREQCEKSETRIGEFQRCARCKWVRYCSKQCQIDHWKRKHSAQCMKKPEDLVDLFKGRRIIIGSDDEVDEGDNEKENTTQTKDSTTAAESTLTSSGSSASILTDYSEASSQRCLDQSRHLTTEST